MALNRREMRERAKIKKWREQDKFGIPGRKNLYGVIDLTPHNAGLVAKRGIDAIRYK